MMSRQRCHSKAARQTVKQGSRVCPGCRRFCYKDKDGNKKENALKCVAIVPPPGLGGVYEENRIWAAQYVKASPTMRERIPMKNSSPAEVLRVTRLAVKAAGTTGEIIYAVGHGGAGTGQAGQVDFAPHMKFRVSQFLAFYDDQSQKWVGPSIAQMNQDLKEAKRAGRKAQRTKEKAWCTAYIADGCRKAKRQVREIDKLQPHYQELGKIFRANPVKRIVLLTCNVANADTFLTELATDLGVPCRAFTERVVSQWRWKGSKKNRRVYMFLDGDRYPNGTNNDRADTELLPGLSYKQRRDARPIATR
jgi:hypothetical protein